MRTPTVGSIRGKSLTSVGLSQQLAGRGEKAGVRALMTALGQELMSRAVLLR